MKLFDDNDKPDWMDFLYFVAVVITIGMVGFLLLSLGWLIHFH